MKKLLIFSFCMILLISSVNASATQVIFKAKDTSVFTYDEAEFRWNGKEWLVTLTGFTGAKNYPAKDIEKLNAVNDEIIQKAKELIAKGNPIVKPIDKTLIPGNIGEHCDPPDSICGDGLVCVEDICQLVTSETGTVSEKLPDEFEKKEVEFSSSYDYIDLRNGVVSASTLFVKDHLIEYEEVESSIQSEQLDKGDYLLIRNPTGEDVLYFTNFYADDTGLKIKGIDFAVDITTDKNIPVDGKYGSYTIDIRKTGKDLYRMKISPEIKTLPSSAIGLFENVEGVLENVNTLMKLFVPFNGIDYTYKIVAERALDQRVSVRALMEEGKLYRTLAEMKNNYERVGPKELDKERVKRIFEKPPVKPKESITVAPAPAAPIVHDEEFDIYGKEINVNINELVDLGAASNAGLHDVDEVKNYNIEGEYIYFNSIQDNKPKFTYVNVEGGAVIDTQEIEFENEGSEVSVGLYRVLLSKFEGERLTVNVLNVESLPEHEVEEEIIPLPEREGNIEDLKDASYDIVVKFIEDNGLDLDDVEYMTRILSIERGEACDPKWNKERGAIAQVVINRVHSGAFPTTVKDVVRADYIPGAARWFGSPNSEIDNEERGIKSMKGRGCVLSALRFFMCQGEENDGAQMIKGRTGFTHRYRLKNIPEWNKINPVEVQKERDAATFSGDDLSDKSCADRNYRAAGPVTTVKKLEGLCFPIEKESFSKNLNDWGNNRGPNRCHAGIDLLTKDPGKVFIDNGVIAIDDGVVTNIFGFTSCKDGWNGPGKAIALLIYHPNLGKTINYGEIDDGGLAPNIKVGSKVMKGQYLGRAGHCGMLHLELYSGQQTKNTRWLPLTGQKATGYRNKCAKEFLSTKPDTLEDPTSFVKALDFCPSSEPLV